MNPTISRPRAAAMVARLALLNGGDPAARELAWRSVRSRYSVTDAPAAPDYYADAPEWRPPAERWDAAA